jgi:hypothetical protein
MMTFATEFTAAQASTALDKLVTFVVGDDRAREIFEEGLDTPFDSNITPLLDDPNMGDDFLDTWHVLYEKDPLHRLGHELFLFYMSNGYIDSRNDDLPRWRVVDYALEDEDVSFSPQETAYLKAVRDSHMGIYQLKKIEKDTVVLTSTIDRTHVTARAPDLYRKRAQIGDQAAIRLLDAGDGLFFYDFIPLQRTIAERLTKELRAMTRLSMEHARQLEDYTPAEEDYTLHLVRALWVTHICTFLIEESLIALHSQTTRRNMDKHVLEASTKTYILKDSAGAVAALRAHKEILTTEDETSGVWVKPMARDQRRIAQVQKGLCFLEDRVLVSEAYAAAPRTPRYVSAKNEVFVEEEYNGQSHTWITPQLRLVVADWSVSGNELALKTNSAMRLDIAGDFFERALKKIL